LAAVKSRVTAVERIVHSGVWQLAILPYPGKTGVTEPLVTRFPAMSVKVQVRVPRSFELIPVARDQAAVPFSKSSRARKQSCLARKTSQEARRLVMPFLRHGPEIVRKYWK
jgi:hypothetical protein